MSREGEELGAAGLQSLFQELSESLQSRGLQAQIFVVGGAAMALAYDHQRLTRDVDALFQPARELRDIAAEIGERHGLEPDWLNDGAKGYMPPNDEHPQTVFESEALLVQVPSPEYLLAMKLHAARDDRDLNDAAQLYNRAGYTTPEQGVELLSRSYPPAMLTVRHRYVPYEVAERAAALRAAATVAKRDHTRTTRAGQIAAKVSDAKNATKGEGQGRKSRDLNNDETPHRVQKKAR